MTYKLSDYKGKYFILCDDLQNGQVPFFPIKTMNESDITESFLRTHVENCIYYGIPAYTGSNKFLHDRIHDIEKTHDI